MNNKLAIAVLACVSLMIGSAAHAQAMVGAVSPAGASALPKAAAKPPARPPAGRGDPANTSDRTVDEGGGTPST